MSVFKSFSVVVILLLSPVSAIADSLAVHNARIHEAPPTVSVMAGYMTLINLTDQELVIKEITSPDFERVEIHATIIRDGVAAMVRQDRPGIAGGATLKLEPGGKHIMLINPARPLRAGDQVELILVLDDGSQIRLCLEVIKASGETHIHQHH